MTKAMGLSVFGCRFFEARQNKVRDFPKRFYLGVKSTGLVAVSLQDKAYLQDWSFDLISRWGNKTDETNGQETLYIQLQSKGNRAKGLLWVIYTEAEAVCELMDKYSMEMFKTLSEEGKVQLTLTEEKAALKILACYRGYQVRKRFFELYLYLNETWHPETL